MVYVRLVQIRVRGGNRMRSDHLVCASCGGIVAQGNCSTCRFTRAQLDSEERFAFPAPLVALMVALIALMLVYVAHQTA